ncbi:hypothetical protein, partial [Guyparkeria sp. SCN-R1]|uniref:hypothetical protein n=1 Tax=Guyparkeria sp. SCN-R1 TaxID=2341113 RepID=UPI00195E7383
IRKPLSVGWVSNFQGSLHAAKPLGGVSVDSFSAAGASGPAGNGAVSWAWTAKGPTDATPRAMAIDRERWLDMRQTSFCSDGHDG